MELSPNFNFSFYLWTGRDSLNADIALIRHSISNHYLLAFEYVDKNGKTSTREIEPYKIYYREQYWYIHGYDRQKCDSRLFKVTRMSHILETKKFSARVAPQSLPESQNFKYSQHHHIEVKLAVEASVLDQFIERYGRESLKRTKGNYQIVIPLPDNKYAYQFLTGFGNNIRLLEPQSFINHYITFLQNTLSQYD